MSKLNTRCHIKPVGLIDDSPICQMFGGLYMCVCVCVCVCVCTCKTHTHTHTHKHAHNIDMSMYL